MTVLIYDFSMTTTELTNDCERLKSDCTTTTLIFVLNMTIIELRCDKERLESDCNGTRLNSFAGLA
jgi:hypothetical protein